MTILLIGVTTSYLGHTGGKAFSKVVCCVLKGETTFVAVKEGAVALSFDAKKTERVDGLVRMAKGRKKEKEWWVRYREDGWASPRYWRRNRGHKKDPLLGIKKGKRSEDGTKGCLVPFLRWQEEGTGF